MAGIGKVGFRSCDGLKLGFCNGNMEKILKKG